MKNITAWFAVLMVILCSVCSSPENNIVQNGGINPPPPVSQPGPDTSFQKVAEPVLLASLSDRYHEGWLASPAIEDLDNDGEKEIVIARENLLVVYHLNGDVVFKVPTQGRIWASPVVADLVPSVSGLEIAAASRGNIYAWDKSGNLLPEFPVQWRDEMRSLAAGDIDNDGQLELIAVTSNALSSGVQEDLIIAFNMNGSVVSGYPPNTSGTSGCDNECHQTGGFDQNVAIGDVDGDGIDDVFATQDNAYLSLHKGNGFAFDSAPIFNSTTKFQGIRFFHDYSICQAGVSDNESVDLQAHFTNSAPAIADVDEDNIREAVVLGSVQNAAQSDRYKGVALWLLNNDGTRVAGWEEPYHVETYLSGLWDLGEHNIVAATNQVTVADIDPVRSGPEFIFAGFDGRIHAVDASKEKMWHYVYTNNPRVLTGGVAVADLTSDGSPEIIFCSYSPDYDRSHLFILDAGGNEQQKILLPTRGSMAVPTIADVNGDHQLEIIINLKLGQDNQPHALVYTMPGSYDNYLPWPTGRGNDLRNGCVK